MLARQNDLITVAIAQAAQLVSSVMNSVAASRMRMDQESFVAEMQEKQAELSESQAELDQVQGEVDTLIARQRMITYGGAALVGVGVLGIGGMVLMRSKPKKKKKKGVSS